MYKLTTTVVCLGIYSLNAFATPRVLLPEESQIEFVVVEMGVPVSGKFKRFDAAIDLDQVRPEKSSAILRIDIGALTTGNDEADALAVGPDWLDKARAPFATFKSASIRELGKGHYEARGMLSIHNREKELAILFSTADQNGGKTMVTGEFSFKRADFAIGGGVWNEGDVVSPEVTVKVRLALAPPSGK